MTSATKTTQAVKESTPEQYLREIRDLQKQNTEILAKMAQMEDKIQRRWKWEVLGKVFMILFPYLFSALLVWYFYTSVQNSISSLTDGIKKIVPHSVVETAQEKVSAGKNWAQQQWDNRDELKEKGSDGIESLKEKWDNL